MVRKIRPFQLDSSFYSLFLWRHVINYNNKQSSSFACLCVCASSCVCVSLWLSLTYCLALRNLTPLLCTLVGRGGSRRSRPEDQDDQDDFQQHHNDGPVMKDYEPVNVGAQVDEPLPSVRGTCCDSSLFCVDGWKCFLTCGIRRLTCNNCF